MNFERYTDRAKGFIQSAQSLALRENHQQVTPDHLLKVLLDDPEGLASGLIQQSRRGFARGASRRSRPVSPRSPRSRAGPGRFMLRRKRRGFSMPSRSLPTRRATSSSPPSGCCWRWRSTHRPMPARSLRDAGVTADKLNAAINDIRKGRTADTANAEQAYDALKRYARDLTEAAATGKLDPVIGRDEEIRRTIQVLSRRTKNNPVLIGEPGVGKTAIAEGWRSASSRATCRKA